jgi:hypothetical protein
MIARKSTAVVPFLLAMVVAGAHGQEAATAPDPADALKQLLSTAMTVSIAARIVPPDADTDTPMWNAESTKLTIPGRSIRVRLDGENVRIYLICTPYVQDDGGVLLLAQGQVWFTEPTDNESKYSSTYFALPVDYGKPLFFYPLGAPDGEAPQPGFYNIEVEIRIERGFEQKQ